MGSVRVWFEEPRSKEVNRPSWQPERRHCVVKLGPVALGCILGELDHQQECIVNRDGRHSIDDKLDDWVHRMKNAINLFLPF